MARRAGQIRRCGIEVQFRPDVATCVGLEWTRRSLGESKQVATSAEPPAKKETCLGLPMSLHTRCAQHPPPRSFLAGHPLQRGTKILQSLALQTQIRSPFEGGSEERAGDVLPGLRVSSTAPTASQPPFFIHGPAPRRSWLAMTEGERRSLRIGWVVGEAHVGRPRKGQSLLADSRGQSLFGFAYLAQR